MKTRGNIKANVGAVLALIGAAFIVLTLILNILH